MAPRTRDRASWELPSDDTTIIAYSEALLAGDLVLDVVDGALGLVLQVADLVLRLAGLLVDLAFTSQVVVAGDIADGLLRSALGFVEVSHERSPCVVCRFADG